MHYDLRLSFALVCGELYHLWNHIIAAITIQLFVVGHKGNTMIFGNEDKKMMLKMKVAFLLMCQAVSYCYSRQ